MGAEQSAAAAGQPTAAAVAAAGAAQVLPQSAVEGTTTQSGTPSRFEAVRALDEDENWRERTEVITKHDHNLNKQLARDIVEQIVDSAVSTPTESSSSVSFATVSSNPPAPEVPGSLPDVVRVAAAGSQDTDSGDSADVGPAGMAVPAAAAAAAAVVMAAPAPAAPPRTEYESASEQEDVPAVSSAVRSETSLLADQLLDLCLQTPLKPGAPRPPPAVAPPQQQQQQQTLLDLSLPGCQQEQTVADLPPPPSEEELLLTQTDAQQLSAPPPVGHGAEGGEPGSAAVREQPAPEEPTPASEELTPAPEKVLEEPLPAPEEPLVERPSVVPEEQVTAPEKPVSAAASGEPQPAEPVCGGETEVRSASPPIRSASPPIRSASPPIRAASPPIRSASPPIRSASPPIRAASPPIRSASPPSASPPIRGASPPIRAASPPIRAGSPPIRSGSPPIRAASPPIRSASPPIRSASPPIRAGSPPIRSGSPPIRPAGSNMTQTGDEDEPIPPKVGYNLDFLDDPSFNPFASGSGVKLSPPPSPSTSLPPLKAAKTKKQREAAAADEPAATETNGVNGSEGSAEPAEQPAKPPAKKPVKKPVRPVKRPLKKKPVPPPEPEPEPSAVEENGRADSPPLAPPPSKGYNLDFLDNCDDPNFNPFATKSAVANSPTGSPKAARKVANSPPPAAKKSPAKPVAKPAPPPEPEPEAEPEPVAEPEPEPVIESQPVSCLEEPVEMKEERPEPLGAGGDASSSIRSETSKTALLDTAPLDFGEVAGASAADQEMASATDDHFVEATNFFHDPSALDRLAEHGDGRLEPNLARNSLYVKFDPLLGRPSVLPELQRLAEGAEEPTPAVPRQLTSVKSDLIAFSPGKEPTEPTPSPPPAAPAPATAADASSAAPPAAAAAPAGAPVAATADSNVSQLLKKQELYFQDQLLKRDREMTAMKNANSKLIQQASNNKTEKLLERTTHLIALLTNENGLLRRELKTSLSRLTAERDDARQEVANAEAMFADLHRKYEKSKMVLQDHRRSAERNDSACKEAQEQAVRERQRYEMLRQHSEDAHTRLQTELEAVEKAHQTELLTVKAKLQLAENRGAKLERENREITAICDELIQKMGGAR